MKEKEKVIIEIIKTQMEDAVVLAKAIPALEDAEDVEDVKLLPLLQPQLRAHGRKDKSKRP
jgi:hypothetical protein